MGTGSSREVTPPEGENASGVGLSPELEETIVRDFQNQTVQEEWNKFRSSVLVRRNERLKNLSAAQQQIEMERQARAAERAQRMAALDESVDELNAKFADLSVALQYDANGLSEKYIIRADKNATLDSRPLPCLGPRAHWIDCQKKFASDFSEPCGAYLEALENCVNETLAKDNA